MLLLGAPEGIRTPDPLVRSQVLYPAELRAQKTLKKSAYIIIARSFKKSKDFFNNLKKFFKSRFYIHLNHLKLL